ncbi:MAG: hypothetical protein U1E17_14760 [Geminicoccaceae bacterium]
MTERRLAWNRRNQGEADYGRPPDAIGAIFNEITVTAMKVPAMPSPLTRR